MNKPANPQIKFEIEVENPEDPIQGTILIELFAKEAPLSVKNFLSYVEDGFYEGTIFHRVIDGFMVQGGGLLPGLKEKPVQPAIKNEASNKLKNTIGTLAMARTSEVDSATCQFFINVNDNDFLNHQNNSAQGYGYAVFGKVLEGMDFINLLKRQPTHTVYYYSDVPVHNIIIKKTTKL